MLHATKGKAKPFVKKKASEVKEAKKEGKFEKYINREKKGLKVKP